MNENRYKANISSEQKLSDVVSSNPEMVQMLQLLRIPLGFGDMSIGQICSRNKLSENFFLALVNMLSNPDYAPNVSTLSSDDALAIIEFLEASHSTYRHTILPSLHANVHKIAELCSADTKSLVNRFFDEYDAEMNRHIESEEENEFNYIKRLILGQITDEMSITKIIKQHDDAETKIEDFKNIILKYVPEECNLSERYLAVIQMIHIANDLSFHTRIEECLLYPLAVKLESGLNNEDRKN